MMFVADRPGIEHNRTALMAHLERLRRYLERHMAGAPEPADPAEDGRTDDSSAATEGPALGRLVSGLDLSPFERDVLLLCAGVELDGELARLCAGAGGVAHPSAPSFGLAFAVLPGPHWSAASPTGPLRHWRLIDVDTRDRLASGPLRIDERILHFLIGIAGADVRLAELMRCEAPPPALPPSLDRLAGRLAALWCGDAARLPAAEVPVVHLCGADRVARAMVAAAAGERLGRPVFSLAAREIPRLAGEREALVRLWMREALLTGALLLIDAEGLDGPDDRRLTTAFLEVLDAPVAVLGAEAMSPGRRPSLRIDVDRPGGAELEALWHQALGPLVDRVNGTGGSLDRVLGQFSLGVQGLRAASAEVRREIGHDPGADPGALLWAACRRQSRPRLDDLARRICSPATWDDIVLPAAQRETLNEIAAQVRHRRRVYDGWGFAARNPRGLGISALFSGASGTGKTLAAEVLGNVLDLDVYRIDLSGVVSKWIGETEKNLRRVFDAAEDGGAILLFDEADALFGKRSEVKDSHDRYANIEVSYLLQRMESYQGLAILTTNFKDGLDPAFMRRLRFMVDFPFPDREQRAAIWARAFPPETPTAGLDPKRLAQLNVAGGNIRNIALNAAFLAAGQGEPVGMRHVLRAARGEYLKLGKSLTDAEVRGWMGSGAP